MLHYGTGAFFQDFEYSLSDGREAAAKMSRNAELGSVANSAATDHRRMNHRRESSRRLRSKKRVNASQWFRSVNGGLSTIAGYEAMNIIRNPMAAED